MPIAELYVQRNGLQLEVEVGPSAPYKALLWRRGLPVNPGIVATFLIDTGADTTMVSYQLMRSLGLTRTGQTRVVTATSAASGTPSDVFAVELVLFPRMTQPRRWAAIEVIARPFEDQGTDGLIGRDLLSQMVLTYDGPGRKAHLQY